MPFPPPRLNLVGFFWTLLEEFCLKNSFGTEASSPQALTHFYPGKTSTACMLLAHRLKDFGMFTYNSLQPAYCLCPHLFPSFSVSAWKVVPSHKLEVAPLKRKLRVGIVSFNHIATSSSLSEKDIRSMHFTGALGLMKDRILFISYVVVT